MTTSVTVRAVNPGLWRELKVRAVKEGLTTGEAVNLAISRWLGERKRKGKSERSFWRIRPIEDKAKDAAALSAKVDEVLYG